MATSGVHSAPLDAEMLDAPLELLELPEEVLVEVASHLPMRDLKTLASCSRTAKRIADDSRVWRGAVERKCNLNLRHCAAKRDRPLSFSGQSWKQIWALLSSGAAQHRACSSCDAFPIMGTMFKCSRCDELYLCPSCQASHPHRFLIRVTGSPATAARRHQIKVY